MQTSVHVVVSDEYVQGEASTSADLLEMKTLVAEGPRVMREQLHTFMTCLHAPCVKISAFCSSLPFAWLIRSSTAAHPLINPFCSHLMSWEMSTGGASVFPTGAGRSPMVVAQLLLGWVDRAVHLRLLLLLLLQPFANGWVLTGAGIACELPELCIASFVCRR